MAALRRSRRLGALIASGFVAGALGASSFAQAPPPRAAVKPPASTAPAAPAGEWRTYGSDLASTRYAALDQITAGNFNSLEVAWRFKTDNFGPTPEFNFQSTPLMVG